MLRRWFDVPWPERDYLFCRERGFIYCPIPKVACTSLKDWLDGLVAEPGDQPSADPRVVHARVLERCGLRNVSRRQARLICADERFIRFALVRNPWERLVSSFLNKFVPLERSAQRALVRRSRLRTRQRLTLVSADEPQSATAAVDRVEGFTFREFVDYVSTERPLKLDKHWRPQHLFLAAHRFDFVGRFESLSVDFSRICELVGLEPTLLNRRNATSYGLDVEPTRSFADCPLWELRAMPAFPRWRQFYTQQLVAQVAAVYRADIARFNYSWHDAARRAA